MANFYAFGGLLQQSSLIRKTSLLNTPMPRPKRLSESRRSPLAFPGQVASLSGVYMTTEFGSDLYGDRIWI